MAISSPGVGSGLDVNGIVSQLMAVERRAVTAVDTKEAKFQAQLTAYGSLKGALSTFQSTVAALASPAQFTAMKATVADATVATVSASGAAAGTYSLEVQTLAQPHKLKSEPVAATSTTIGSGTLTISFGTYSGDTFALNADKASTEISIASGQSSLVGIRDAINAADAGVTAGIVNDGTGYRLTVSSKETGVANAVRIAVNDDDGTDTDTAGLSQLAYDGRTVSGVTNLTETVAAQNATALVDGIAINKASNTFTDVIEGVTLTLLKENTPDKTTVTIARDTAGIQASVEAFVKSYNDLNKTISGLSKYDAANKKPSTLTGDATVRAVQTQLRNVFNTALSTSGGGFTALADIGITFQTDGTLKLDSSKLSTALADSNKDISTLFAAKGKPTDSLVSFVSSTADTKNGSYFVDVSALATQGTAVGSGPATLTVGIGLNDTLELTVDGIAVTVTLAPGVYTATGLTAEIKSKVNGVDALKSAGVGIDVSESGGVLTMTSNSYGAASSVLITGGSAETDLFGVATETVGENVAGVIGGAPAIGSGQTLTATGDASGLALKVNGGATGDRGTVSFARGYAYELEKLVARMLENDSLLDGRMDGINASIKDIGKQREQLEVRLENIEKRYRAQFTALDAMVSRMQSTANYLQQQLANLPKPDALKE
ncbi:MAG: flagellar filament capping protein FliD [Burkholderiales bacterium]